MAFKFGKMVVHSLIIGLLIAILYLLIKGNQSGYEPADLVTNPGSNARGDPSSIFDLNTSLKCTPGPSDDAAYYTTGLTPGGLCNSGQYVRDQMRDYSIADGIGGSLLEK